MGRVRAQPGQMEEANGTVISSCDNRVSAMTNPFFYRIRILAAMGTMYMPEPVSMRQSVTLTDEAFPTVYYF